MCPNRSCCCHVYTTIVPCEVKTTTTKCTETCCVNEKYLDKLKKSNSELKGLIKKLDNLTESMSIEDECCKCCSSSSKGSNKNTKEIIITEHHYDCCSALPKRPSTPPPSVHKSSCCGLCKDSTKNTHTIKCDYAICDKCEKMLRLAELEKAHKSRSRSRSRESCRECIREDLERARSKSRERERARSRSRSRSLTRWYHTYRARSASSSSRTSLDDLQRPVWNGGPYVSYYNWRDYKLKEERK